MTNSNILAMRDNLDKFEEFKKAHDLEVKHFLVRFLLEKRPKSHRFTFADQKEIEVGEYDNCPTIATNAVEDGLDECNITSIYLDANQIKFYTEKGEDLEKALDVFYEGHCYYTGDNVKGVLQREYDADAVSIVAKELVAHY